MNNVSLFDALENCLQALDEGADVESCLANYPELAEELRPVLFAAMEARAAAVTDVPADVARRGRARVLQAAAEMREQRNVAPLLPFWRKTGFFGARFYRLAAATAVVIIFLLTGGTGLVNASNGALPGDNLYPVKRGWEGVQLVFVLDPKAKTELERKFDSERVQEIEELYSEKRFEQVNFQGVVQTQQPNIWVVSGLEVVVEGGTVFSGEIAPGALVQIFGETDDGAIKAERIVLLATPGVTPTVLSPSTATPFIIQGITPESIEKYEEPQTPESGEDSGSDGSTKIEDAKTPEAPKQSESESGSSFSPTSTQSSGHDGSGSNDNSGEDNSQPSTDDSGGGSDD